MPVQVSQPLRDLASQVQSLAQRMTNVEALLTHTNQSWIAYGPVSGAVNTGWLACPIAYNGQTGDMSPLQVTVGTSGQVVVNVGGSIATSAAGKYGYLGLSVDGGSYSTFCTVETGAAGGFNPTVTGIQVLQLTPGVHTFTVGYLTSGSSVDFYDPQPFLAVQSL